MSKSLAGMHAALLTAMTDDGEFDPVRQRVLNAHVIAQGLAGLYVGGSSGESGLLESDALIEQQAVVAESAGGSPVALIAHVGMPSLATSIRLARHAEKRGYHALSALPPHAYPFSDGEILDYYRALASATSLPLIAYEIPLRTGRPLPLGLLHDILALPGVHGIKFSSNDLFKFSLMRSAHPDKLLFFGFDEIYGAGAFLGSDGGIGTTYNVFGRLYVALHRAVNDGDVRLARELQDISRRFVEILMAIGVVPGTKLALGLLGVDVGPSRPPMALLREDGEARLRPFLDEPAVRHWLTTTP
ncbi:MAG: dihydrodipicolinate synthase family protein [Geminicoccaceae bacterium]